jgi:hypothetical protein
MKITLRKLFLLAPLFLVLVLTTQVFADPPGPPGPGGSPVSGGGTPVGAPVDNDVIILIFLGAMYGLYKIYLLRKRSTQDVFK